MQYVGDCMAGLRRHQRRFEARRRWDNHRREQSRSANSLPPTVARGYQAERGIQSEPDWHYHKFRPGDGRPHASVASNGGRLPIT